ncbi:MAG: hypothetical protein KKA84_07330 [Bacteroidetes bacterium]|nr:hypothetical protein [Bacteroidota bacterium]
MKIYIAFDDTDTLECGRGTGKLARWFEDRLPANLRMLGVIRHQLLVADDIPYTSHNSSLCMIADSNFYDEKLLSELIDNGADHIKQNFFEGSDPGFCIATENDSNIDDLVSFAHICLRRKVTQKEAMNAVGDIHLSGHGGTNDGIIGAAAAVGLTHEGMSGRFIEIGGGKRLRDFEELTTVKEIRDSGIKVISVSRHSSFPNDNDMLDNKGWLRPRLFMGKAILPITLNGQGIWETVGYEKKQGDE